MVVVVVVMEAVAVGVIEHSILPQGSRSLFKRGSLIGLSPCRTQRVGKVEHYLTRLSSVCPSEALSRLGQRARARQVLWRRLPGLKTERAEVGAVGRSEGDAP